MKKKRMKLLLVIMVILLTACEQQKRDKEDTLEVNYDINFDSKLAIKELDDGWVHYFLCVYEKDSMEPNTYIYDAYNLKYKYLEDYKIEVVDANNMAIGTMMPSLPYLIADETYEADITQISNFFMEKKFSDTIVESDLDGLVVEKVDKKLLLELYNEAIESEKIVTNKYYNYPEADIIQEEQKDGYRWQVGYFIVQGVIQSVNIELIYEDGVYLTDIVKKNEASALQVDLAEEIEEVEINILKNCSFEIDETGTYDMNSDMYDRLKQLLYILEPSNS